MKSDQRILPLIVLSQFFCTSMWFAGNAVLHDVKTTFQLTDSALGHITSAVQLGFIFGTLIFALFSISDRYSPSKVFAISGVLGALSNVLIIWSGNTLWTILLFRMLTGFFLAGIYPVGMKIAADYFEKGLGKSLGFLVGALVLGTALPHLLADVKGALPWQAVMVSTSSLALLGGGLIYFLVPDGPYRKAGTNIEPFAIMELFKHREFRSSALGYFGHMWELYAFWAIVPLIFKLYVVHHALEGFNTSLFSFLIIGIGGLGCVFGGLLSQNGNTKKVAYGALLISGVCCLMAPFAFFTPSITLFTLFLLVWGMAVVADSPLLSTLVAQHSPEHLRGTALTMVNSIGFFISVISIQLVAQASLDANDLYFIALLAFGPLIGISALTKKGRQKT